MDETSYGSDGHTTTKSFDDRQNEESFNNYQEQNTKTFNNFNETESYSGYYKEKTMKVFGNKNPHFGDIGDRWCMVVVSSCREMLG